MPEQAQSDYDKMSKASRRLDFTKIEIDKQNQTILAQAREIHLLAIEKVDDADFNSAEIILRVNEGQSEAQINADKISLAGKTIDLTSDIIEITSTNFSVDTDGKVVANEIEITGGNINLVDNGSGSTSFLTLTRENDEHYINCWSDEIEVGNEDDYYYTKIHSGNLSCFAGVGGPYTMEKGVSIYGTATNPYINIWKNQNTYDKYKENQISCGNITLKNYDNNQVTNFVSVDDNYITMNNLTGHPAISIIGQAGQTTIDDSGIITPTLTQTSLESEKKNFKELENALDIIKDIDIYKYNFKTEEDEDKKHIGFVIGDMFNYREEVTSKNNDGVDIYSFVSVCCKAIQELNERIEKLEEENKKLKEG